MTLYFLRRFSILGKDFREDLGLHQYYFGFDLIRYFTIPLVVSVLFGYTLLQMKIFFFKNIIFFFFVVSETPFKTPINNKFSFVNELCLLASNFSVFLLAILDIVETIDVDLRINIGWIFFASYILLLISLLLGSLQRILNKIMFLINKIT